MNPKEKKCFFIMPFKAELNYFYLYLQKYIEEKHNVEVERADQRIETIPMLEKIIEQIQEADIMIADITERNANVFYELGFAHASGRKVILITSDKIKKAPTDISHYEFIKYDLKNHSDFLSKLENALSNALVKDYQRCYKKAKKYLKQFNKDMNHNYRTILEKKFCNTLSGLERTQAIPKPSETKRLKEVLLPLIISKSEDPKIMEQINKWLQTQ